MISNTILFAIVAFILGVIAGGIWFGRREVERLTKAGEQKEERKEKIMQLARKKGKVANDDIEKKFKVSDATATNYLSELEEEGLLRQQGGDEGRAVYYVPK